MSKKAIYYLNWEKDSQLIAQIVDQKKVQEYIQLELGKSLYHNLCQMVAQQLQFMREITPARSQGPELHSGAYKAAIYSLVYKWELEKTGLLEAWSQLGCRLARGHYFTNGNKRAALLAMITFIHACGFRLKDDKNNKILLIKWEKLLLDIATAESEELAVELTKDR
ncbi:MAG: hypothetical protein MRERV_12c001, partial [Mycoplasmataceae bacterium RV_VA103A]